MVEPDRPQMT